MQRGYKMIITLTILGITLVAVAEEAKTVRLRSEPATVSTKEVQQVFGLTTRKLDWGTTDWAPRTYSTHQYEDQGEVVVDRTTGLMWQKSGSSGYMDYQDAQAYITRLNAQNFAGHNDWRLPTIPELMSLLEPERQSNGLFINPIFDKTQEWCWSADRLPAGESSLGPAWGVYFHVGIVDWGYLVSKLYVRAVRS
jgi:hypothetical protein